MADVFSKEKRSQVMRSVRSKKNKTTELRLIEIFKQESAKHLIQLLKSTFLL